MITHLKKKLFVGRPNIGNRKKFLKRVNKMLDERWLSNDGPFVREFEKKVAKFLRVKHVVAVCNATAAIEMACHALGLKGEVILPSYTFIATAHALQWQGITPVFCDIDPRTHNIDPLKIKSLLTDKTTGIIGVHVWGRPCNTDALERIATRHGLKVMYDASHAFGCNHKGKKIGNFGECEVFSFHATKFINCFEGGAITTNQNDLAEKLRLMRNFGFADFDKAIYLGINGKMSEVHAAMGLTNMEAIKKIVNQNKKNYKSYKFYLSKTPEIKIIEYNKNVTNNYQYVVAEVDPKKSSRSRDEIVDKLHQINVIARKYFWPGCHNMEPYKTIFPNAGENLKETEILAKNIIVLPTGQAVNEKTIRYICQKIQKFLSYSR